MNKNHFLSAAICLLMTFSAAAQKLQPGFDKREYLEMLKITARHSDSAFFKQIPFPEDHRLVYKSPSMGLDNQWNLWISYDRHSAVLSVRGSTLQAISWIANFYSAMVPAEGSLSLAPNEAFHYRLADNPRAAVHVGWLIGMAYLSKDMLPKIDSCYRRGIKNIYITGHSQGGAISYLLTAYLYHLQRQGQLPKDIRFKTYCAAGPKPGNLYFAYDYEAMTQQGWAYNVVNAADWVPEVPVSVQTLNDYNNTNPFINAKQMIKKQRFPKNIVLRYAYNRLDKPCKKAQRRYQRYMGKMMSQFVRKQLKDYKVPVYINSCDYVRCGNYIVLQPDSAYYKLYPDNPQTPFVHHMFEPYFYLASRL
jgi:hypothetical protein